jgi:hypothetical protein
MLILVVDDEPDVEVLFRQQFRRDLRAGRFTMEMPNPLRWRFSVWQEVHCERSRSSGG